MRFANTSRLAARRCQLRRRIPRSSCASAPPGSEPQTDAPETFALARRVQHVEAEIADHDTVLKPDFDGCFALCLVRGYSVGECFHYMWRMTGVMPVK
jgi:hypothetical protein